MDGKRDRRTVEWFRTIHTRKWCWDVWRYIHRLTSAILSLFFWKIRKLPLNLPSNVLVGFHTCLEHTFYPITPSSLARPLPVCTQGQRKNDQYKHQVLIPIGTPFVLKVHSFFFHSVHYGSVNGKQKEGNNWTWNLALINQTFFIHSMEIMRKHIFFPLGS